MISIPVDATLEAQAVQVLERIGLTAEAAVRLLYIHLAEWGTLPDALKVPNAATREALVDAEAIIGKRHRATSPTWRREPNLDDVRQDGEGSHQVDGDGHD